jgi:2-hydroxychromene-2-carboxylate isomerase
MVAEVGRQSSTPDTVVHPWGLAVQEIEFFFGLGSRYSYLAFTQIARIETSYSCKFNLQPIGSEELLHLRGASPFQGAPLSGQYEWDYRRRDAAAWAEYYGIPFVEPKPLPKDHRLMARACYAADMQGALQPYCEAMFQAVFVSNENIDEQTCAAIASRIKLDACKFIGAIGSSAVKERVAESARRAFERGAFGLPTFCRRQDVLGQRSPRAAGTLPRGSRPLLSPGPVVSP